MSAHTNTMEPGQTKWLLNWHEARLVRLIKPLPHSEGWESMDENQNQFFGHETHFYDSGLECWQQALENARDSVSYAEMQITKLREA